MTTSKLIADYDMAGNRELGDGSAGSAECAGGPMPAAGQKGEKKPS